MNAPPNKINDVPDRMLKNKITLVKFSITNIMMLKKQNNITEATNAATNTVNNNDNDPTPQLYNDDRIALVLFLAFCFSEVCAMPFSCRLFSLMCLLA